MSGSVQRREWKAGLRAAICSAESEVLAPGPVAVEMVWTVSPRRNWVGLWKPTGDAMGPILGETRESDLFNPKDDRVTGLGLHHQHDSEIGFEVDDALCWKHLVSNDQRLRVTCRDNAQTVCDPYFSFR